MAIDTIKSVAIFDGSVATADIADDAVTNAKIGAGAVGTTEVADDAITGAKIENNPTIAGNLAVTGGTTMSSTANIAGALTMSGNNFANNIVMANGGTGGTTFNMFSTSDAYAQPSANWMLHHASAGNGIILADQTGTVRMPYQPAAVSVPAANITNVTGDATTYYSYQGNGGSGNATYNDIYDQNADMSNGTFTAPVTGKYLVCINVEFQDVASNHSSGVFYINTSNRNYQRLFQPRNMSNVGVNIGLPMSQIVDADANDVIRWALYVGGGSKVIDITTNTNFGVILLS